MCNWFLWQMSLHKMFQFSVCQFSVFWGFFFCVYGGVAVFFFWGGGGGGGFDSAVAQCLLILPWAINVAAFGICKRHH